MTTGLRVSRIIRYGKLVNKTTKKTPWKLGARSGICIYVRVEGSKTES